MEVTEVRIRLRTEQDRKLKAYATITFDDAFVVRDLKVIEGGKGLFVAMPSRKATVRCPECGGRNVVRSKFCNQCGKSLEGSGVGQELSSDWRSEYSDIAHPITTEYRDYLQGKVLEAYEKERAAGGEATDKV